MKRLLMVFATASILAACGNNSKTGLDSNKEIVTLKDSSQLNNYLTDTGSMVSTLPLGISAAKPANNAPVRTSNKTTTKSSSSNSTVRNSNGSGSSNSSGTTTTTTTRKKGWSKAAKGAVIGAGSGAVIGAVVSKNKGKGAVIGAVVGAAGGYILGRSKDRKDGRVIKKN